MRRQFIRGGIVAIALASVAVAGCNREPERAGAPTTGTQPNASVSDDELATYVQSRFYTDSMIRGSEIDVSADNGVVTLRGNVPSEQARQHAVDAARQVEGVTSVDDQLSVETADATTAANRDNDRTAQRDEESPGWITTKIQSQYYLNPSIKPWNINVTTSHDGVVTLTGEVEEAGDREQAERIAQSTEGVTRVINRLRLHGESPTASNDRTPGTAAPDAERASVNRPDGWVTAKIQSKYFMDPDVKGREINVDTREGVVTLSGTVESQAERRQALALARNTEGVTSVTDQLRVVPAEPEASPNGPANRDQAAMDAPDDGWITTKIQAKYFLDTDVKGRNIDVNTSKGVVTLTGTVASDAERQAASAIAQETDGVVRVNNQLKVDATMTR